VTLSRVRESCGQCERDSQVRDKFVVYALEVCVLGKYTEK
jgi:hypothetical protein